MAFENYEDMRAGDVIECFRVEMVRPGSCPPHRFQRLRYFKDACLDPDGQASPANPGLPSQRQLRAGEIIRHALAEIIAREDLRDPELSRACSSPWAKCAARRT
jgi:hypothetical protein